MNKIILAVLFFASAAYADPAWNGLRVTWSALPVSKWGFDKLPRDLADNTQFEKKDDMCADGGKKFLGQRYWYQKDPTLILLFDNNGIIAGVQNAAPKSRYSAPPQSQGKYYLDDGDYWTVTTYFVDPSTICSQGRSKADLASQGTGTGLWLQYGQDPIKDSVKIPDTEEEMKKTKWGHGKCFYTMGMHYWYNVTQDMDCDDFAPNCILYNGGKLNAFCFSTGANLINLLDPVRRWDFPAPLNVVLNKFLNPVPDCFFKNPRYVLESTMHIYFNDSPRTTSNC